MPNIWHFKLPTFGLIFAICVHLHHLYLVWPHTELSSTSEYIFPCFGEFVHISIWLLCTDIISNKITPQWSTLRKLRPELLYLKVSFSLQVQTTSVDISLVQGMRRIPTLVQLESKRNCDFSLNLQVLLFVERFFEIVLQGFFTLNYEN